MQLEKGWARKTDDEQRFFGEETLILKSTYTCSTMWLLQRWHQKDELSKCIECNAPKKEYLYASFTDAAMQASVTPSDFVDFVDAEARNMAGCRELPRFRAAELTPVTARVQYMRYTTLLHNIAQVGLLRKYRTPQVPIRKIWSTLLGVSFILSPQNKYRTPTFPACKRFGWATSTSSCLRPIGCTWFGWPPCEGWRITWENI